MEKPRPKITSRASRRLTREAWILQGFRALAAEGPAALKAEPLARAMGTSKGSFYWHFKDLAAFKAAVLEMWQHRAVADIIAAVDQGGMGPADRLYALVERISEIDMDPYGGPQIEMALRDWGRSDALAAAATEAVDQARLDWLEAVFRDLGGGARSDDLARAAYGCFIGIPAVPGGGGDAGRRALAAVMAGLIGDAQAGGGVA